MSFPAASEESGRLGIGALPEELKQGSCEHVAGCARCQALLEQLSDDPDLRRRAPAVWPAASPVPSEAALAGALEQLHAVSPLNTFGPRSTAKPLDAGLRFLSPPEQAGDLGKLGPYRVLAELGRGGMGIVLRAYDPELERIVAIKVLPPDRADERARSRFVREARAAAGLSHDHVVPVYAVANPADGPPYLVMQYVEGPTLRQRIKLAGRLDPREAARICVQVAEGLAAAHRAGLIHRDIKPANIMLESATGRARIMDFGLVQVTSLPRGMTQEGVLSGTPEYMSPEQVRQADRLDARSDVYSLGATLYEALTGEVPFRGVSHLVLQQVLHDEPRPPRRLNDRVPRDLETICLRCLHKEAGKRYRDAEALADDLRRFLAGEPIRARPIRSWDRVVKWAKRRPAIAALLALVVFVTALGFGAVTWQWRAEQKARRMAEQNSYFNLIALAGREIEAKNWGRAEELLEQCEERWRGWEWYYLKRLRLADPLTLPLGGNIHMGGGFDLAFSLDGRFLAVPAGDQTIKVWDVTGGERRGLTPRFTLPGHPDQAVRLAFSLDGRRLASTSQNTVKVWDMTVGQARNEILAPVFTLTGHKERVLGVTFSPDGRRLATASNDETVKVWDATTGERLHDLPGQSTTGPRLNSAFSPDGRWLASGSRDNTVKVWDSTTGEEVFTLPGHSQPVFHLAFSPDGRRLASVGWDRLVKVWNLTTGARGVLNDPLTFTGHSMGVWCAAFSPDGGRLAVGGAQPADVRVHDVQSGQPLLTLQGHSERVISVAWSPDGQRLASASLDKHVKLWETTTGQEVLTLRGHTDVVSRVLFSSDGQRLASASGDGTVRVWDASPPDEGLDRRIQTLAGHEGIVYGVAYSPDGWCLASASADKSVKLWDVASGQVVRTLHGHTDTVFSVTFHPDGWHLLSASNDKTVRLWDTGTGQQVGALTEFHDLIRSAAWSPDGQRIVTASLRDVQIWDALTRRQLVPPLRVPEVRYAVWCLTFSPDGKLLATASTDRTVRLWNVTTGQEERKLQGHTNRVYSVAFSPAGQFLASGGADRQVKIWDTEKGLEQRTLAGHTDYVFGTAFSPDGRYLATASWREVIVWDACTFAELHTLGRFAGTIWSVAFSPDSKRLAAAGGYKDKGEIKIWDTTLWDKPAGGER